VLVPGAQKKGISEICAVAVL